MRHKQKMFIDLRSKCYRWMWTSVNWSVLETTKIFFQVLFIIINSKFSKRSSSLSTSQNVTSVDYKNASTWTQLWCIRIESWLEQPESLRYKEMAPNQVSADWELFLARQWNENGHMGDAREGLLSRVEYFLYHISKFYRLNGVIKT